MDDTTPLTPPPLADVATVKAWFSPPLTSTTDDALLTRLIQAESGFIRAWLGRDPSLATYTQTLDGTGNAVLPLPHYPVTDVMAVAVDGTPVPAQAADQPLAYGYAYDDTSLVLTGGIFPRGRRRVSVTWTAGHDPLPAILQQACVELVALRYRERDRVGLVSKAHGGETTSYLQKEMPDSLAAALAPYRRVAPI
ncbi:hypothetical protein VPG91_00695 [Nitrospirillum amazonense]|uniref:hypothetical protein n=1 Tax=Nitrospirillum amazonense TaxID=28077 RepID=UPI002DD451EF|nr:hypothetical protein [Nitrospirillum amazonense]MEC4589493.1 hypothetical protein [Nitrospirillum amazonense]